MLRPSIALLTLLVACKNGDTTTDTDEVGGENTEANTAANTDTPGVDGANCEVDSDNTLLVRCSVTLESAGTTTLTLSATGAPTRSFPSESGTELEVVGWALKPETEYAWEIGGVQGTVSTGALPSDLQGANIQLTGAPVGFDAVLMPMTCDSQYFTMVDGDGDVVWYLQNSLYKNGMDAYEWAEDETSLLIGSGTNVVEFSVTGEQLNSWSGYSGNVHHDLDRWNGYTYMLHNYDNGNATVDAIHIYDGQTLVDTIDFADHYDTSQGQGEGGPGGDEWGHANGINLTPDGELVVSLLLWSSVVVFDADPTSATFTDKLWVVDGTGDGLPGADYLVGTGGDDGFERQHNASFHDGKLFLFDNTGTGGESRAARFNLNANTGEIEHEESWGVESSCPTEGGSVPIAGGVLATCANSRDVFEFRDGSATATFELNASCGGGGGGPGGGGGEGMNRGIPIVY